MIFYQYVFVYENSIPLPPPKGKKQIIYHIKVWVLFFFFLGGLLFVGHCLLAGPAYRIENSQTIIEAHNPQGKRPRRDALIYIYIYSFSYCITVFEEYTTAASENSKN